MARKPANAKTASLIDNTARATQSIARAITGRRKGSEGISIHVHVGDLFLIGFDEAVDAEEWGAREVNHDGTGVSARAAARQDADPERKTKRRLSFRKGDVQVIADEEAEPASPARKRRRSVKAGKKAVRRRR